MISTTRADELMKSPVHLTAEERAEAQALIARGELPADALERQAESEARNVFGHDARKDRNGRFQEQGIGAIGNESLNHFEALKAAERQGYEKPGAYRAAVDAMWKRNPARAKLIGLEAPHGAAA